MKTNADLESIFAEAIELTDPSRRGAFLDQVCAGDASLRNRVARLLRANQRAKSFMSEPATLFKLPLGLFDDEHGPIGEREGDRVGRYKLREQIGEGGMGVVFLAEQQAPISRKVALKIVKPGLDTKEVIARFEAERQALALMNHPNIARVLDVGATETGRPFFVMELVKGEAITDYCNGAKLTHRERLRLFQSVCEAIQHAHHKGIIHRDIKPRNVMITQVDGKPVAKVIDFGIAKAVDQRLTDKTLFTRPGEFIGTPAYMSPEQAQHSGIDIDTRTDVYSLGALLYELLTGRPPFDEERLRTLGHEELRRVIREETPPPPSAAISTMQNAQASTVVESHRTTRRELQTAVLGELDWIVMRAMDKDRDRRYETANALSCDLQRFLDNEPVTARPPTLVYQWKKFVRRNRPAVTAGVAIATTLLLATFLTGWWAWQANHLFGMEKAARQRADEKTEEANALRQLAENEAASLQEVVDFINQDLFAQASPLREQNRNIRLRTVLDRAARKVNARTFSQPSIEAAIRTSIGETYRGLGEYQQALLHLERAQKIFASEFGDRHEKTLGATNKIIRVLLHQSKYDGANSLLDTNLSAASRELGPKHEVTLEAMNLDAWRLEATGAVEEAERVLHSVLRHRLETVGADAPETYKAMANLAFAYQSLSRYDEALPLLEKANDGLWRSAGEWHPDALKATSSLASLQFARNEIEQAEQLYHKAAARAETLLGQEHEQTQTIKHGLALIQVSRQRYAEAEELLEVVLEQQRAQLGDAHTNTLTTMHNLALVHKSQGRIEEAESLLKEELKGRHATFGATNPTTQDATTNLAFFYVDQGRFAEAIPYYRQAASVIDRAEMGDAAEIMVATMLGLCEHKIGDESAARSTLSRTLKRCEDSMPEHWLRFVVESLLGEVHFASGKRKLAEDALLRGYEGLKLTEAEVPSHWKPLGLRAAIRRLVSFYESASAEPQQARADQYRAELKTLYPSPNEKTPTGKLGSQKRKIEDDGSN